MVIRQNPTGVAISDVGVRSFLLLCVTGCWLLLALQFTKTWLKHSGGAVTLAVAAALVCALAYGYRRVWRMGLRMDAQGATVRNLWRTHKISWPEVSHLGDGSVSFLSGDGAVWAPAFSNSRRGARP